MTGIFMKKNKVLFFVKDIDDFVNDVIDYLKVDFFRVNDSQKLNTGNIRFCNYTFLVAPMVF